MSKKSTTKSTINPDSLDGPVACDQGKVRIDIFTDNQSKVTRVRLSVVGFLLINEEGGTSQPDILGRLAGTYVGFTWLSSSTSEVLVGIDDKTTKDTEMLMRQLRAFRRTAVDKLNSMERQRLGTYHKPVARNSAFDNEASRSREEGTFFHPRARSAQTKAALAEHIGY